MADDILGLDGGAGEGEGQGAEGAAAAAAGAGDAGGQGAGAAAGEGEHPKWHGVLPKEYQGHEALKDVEGMDQLLKGYVGLKGLEGATVVPGKDASDEAKAKFYEAIGVPKDADSYSIDKVEVLEGMTLTGDIMPEYKQVFHALKLNQNQANELFKTHMEIEKAKFKAEQEAKEQAKNTAIDGLKTKHGADYDKVVNIANKALRQHVDEEAFKRLKEQGFTSNPDVVEIFYGVGKATLDDSVLGGSGAGSSNERPVDQMGRKTFSFGNTKGS
jgi:hypothetical protein